MYFDESAEAKQYGIENLEAAAKGLLDVADIAGDVFEDKKVNFEDIPHLLRVQSIWGRLKSSPQALQEALDLTKEETDQLRESITAHANELRSDVGPDQLEKIVELGLAAALSVVNLLSAFKKD